MTPQELTAKRQELGLTKEAFARMVRVGCGRTVRRWEDGANEIPGPVIRILEMADVSDQVRWWLITKSQAPRRAK